MCLKKNSDAKGPKKWEGGTKTTSYAKEGESEKGKFQPVYLVHTNLKRVMKEQKAGTGG